MTYVYCCTFCSVEFSRSWKSKTKTPFCSKSCANRANPRRHPEGACRQCASPISARRSYCSKECRATAYANKISRIPSRQCVMCGSTMSSSRKYCSRNCANRAKHLKSTHLNGIKSKNGVAVVRYRQRRKLESIKYLGGSCSLCGYDRCPDSLHFHHKDPSQKDFSMSSKGLTRSWEHTKHELDKCILLCANCHGEVHFLNKF